MFSRHAKQHALLRTRFLRQFHQGGTLYICPHALQKPSQSVCAFGLTSWGFMVTQKRGCAQNDSALCTASFPYSKSRLHLLFLLQCQQRLHVECTFETLFLNLAANFVRLSYIAVE